MGILANLGVSLTLNSAKYKEGLDDATKNTQKFEANAKKSMKNAAQASAEMGATFGRLAGAIAVVVTAMYQVAKKADEIADTADAFDSTIESVLGLEKALMLSGGKAEALGASMNKLAMNQEQAREGNEKLREAFAKLNITAAEVENLNPVEMYARLAGELSKVEDVTTRVALAQTLLGKAAKGTDWKKFAQEYKEVADPALASAIRDAADAWDAMQKSAKDFYYVIVKLMQPLFAIIKEIRELSSGARYKQFKEEGGTINFSDNPYDEGISYKGEGKDLSKQTQKLPEKPKAGLEGNVYTKKTDAEQNRIKERQAIMEAFNIKVKMLETTAQQINRETQLIGLNEREAEELKMRWALEDENLRMQLDLEKQIQVEKAKGKDADEAKIAIMQSQKALYAEQIELAQQMAEVEIRAKEDKIRRQQVLTNVEKEGMSQLEENFKVLGQQSKAAFNAWKAFSIVNALIDTYSGAQKAFTSLAGIPIIGPALGTAAAAVAIAAGMARVQMIRSQQYQGRQAGGAIVANTPYIVGERGPELVVPHRGGTVIPNNQLSGALGGGGGVVYNGPYIANMSAIDTQSAMQFLAKNKESVWAANQSASRSMPASRN